MTDVEKLTPAARLRHAYALWTESGGTRSDQWIELLGDAIEMRSVLSPDLPDDLAAHRRNLSGALEYFQTVARDWEMLDFTVERFVDGGDDVVMVGRCAWRNRATGRDRRHAQGRRLAFRGRQGGELPRNVRQPRLRSRHPVRRRDGPGLSSEVRPGHPIAVRAFV